jgi:LacI family transcriptional regulator, repressor for deo operon, udp, cdd, tsx, nupC, and nupG
VEGIIFVGGPHHENLSFVEGLHESSPLAIIAIDPFSQVALPQVSVDREYAMTLSLEKLYNLGHRKIALFGIRDDVIYGSERVKALKQASEKLGLEWGRDVVTILDKDFAGMNYEGGRRLASLFLEEATECSSILAINDQVAIGAMGYLQGKGISIPSDVSVMGFDNLDVSSHLHPTLASIDQCIYYSTTESVNLLIDGMTAKGESSNRRVKVKPEFIEGESIGPARSH